MEPVLVPARFNGPAGSGNGGWVSGRLAAVLAPAPDEAVRVVLRSPPPLDVPLQVQAGADGGLSAWSGDVLVATVNRVPSPFGVPAADPVPWAVALSAADAYAGAVDHPFPTCFVCGPRREPGDGLRLAPGRLPGRPTDTAAAWVPDASLAEAGSDRVDLAVCWAALDCPGGWSLDLVGRPMVLGTMTAQVRELPRVGGRYVVVGRALGQQGRRAFTETVLYDASEGGVFGSGSVASDSAAGGSAAGGSAAGGSMASGSTAPDPVALGSGAGAVPRAAVPLARAASVWLHVDPATVRPA